MVARSGPTTRRWKKVAQRSDASCIATPPNAWHGRFDAWGKTSGIGRDLRGLEEHRHHSREVEGLLDDAELSRQQIRKVIHRHSDEIEPTSGSGALANAASRTKPQACYRCRHYESSCNANTFTSPHGGDNAFGWTAWTRPIGDGWHAPSPSE